MVKMDFTNPTHRSEAVSLMKEIASARQAGFDRSLDILLSPAEKAVQSYVQELGFREGAWYRPSHNTIVTAAMVAICGRENYSRKLVFAAQLHDAGNSLMKLADTTEGASWEAVDKRWKHMELGGVMLYTALGLLRAMGQVEISDEEIINLKRIVDAHDLPYLGGKLTNPEAQAHRCADRVFVPSALSWYKDMIAHFSDKSYLKKAEELGFELSPQEFLISRMAFFYPNGESLPQQWDSEGLPLILARAAYNEGGRCEPAYTATGKEMIDNIFLSRAGELEQVGEATTPQQFASLFERVFVEETKGILSLAKGRD